MAQPVGHAVVVARVVPDVPERVARYADVRHVAAAGAVKPPRQDAAVAGVLEHVVAYGDVAGVRCIHVHSHHVLGQVAVGAVCILELVVACSVPKHDPLDGHVAVEHADVRCAREYDSARLARLGAYGHAPFRPARVSRQVDVAVRAVGDGDNAAIGGLPCQSLGQRLRPRVDHRQLGARRA